MILTTAVGLPAYISNENKSCLLKGSLNDRLSPTELFLDVYGIG